MESEHSRDTPANAEAVTLGRTSVGGQVLRARLQERLFGIEVAAITLGRFQLLELLGKGGMGVVYRAYDPLLDRRVAVKVVAIDGDDARQRMIREAKALARLNHPNVVTIHEVGEDRGELFVAMELVDGGTLESWCRAHPERTPERTAKVLELAAAALEGLVAAHALGIVHRDVKPANLLIGADGRLRVADFGLARTGGNESASDAAVVEAGDATLTRSGAAIGTPAYMSPEQFRGVADERSDQFGFCATFFEALYGVRPFAGTSIAEILESVEANRITPIDAAGVDERVHRALVRGLRRDPAERFADLRELAAVLRPVHPRRWRMAALAGVAAASIAATIAVTRPPECSDGRTRIDAVAGEGEVARLSAAIAASGRPHPEELATRVRLGLAEVVERWTSGQLDACRVAADPNPAVAALATSRRACLDHGLATVEATLSFGESMTIAEANSLPNTIALLVDVVDCSRAEPSVYESTEGLELVARLREGTTALLVSDNIAARSAFMDVLARTEPDRLPSLRADAHLQLVALDRASGARDAAHGHAVAALAEAERSDDPELVALAWMVLTHAIPEDVSDAMLEVIVGRVRTLVREETISAHVHARLLLVEAMLRIDRGQHERAAALTRDAIAMAEPISHGELPQMYATLAGVLQLLGDSAEALVAARAAVDATSGRLGDHHPDLAPALIRLADVQSWACDDVAAIGSSDRAIELLEAMPGQASNNLVAAHVGRAASLAALGQHDEAVAELEQTLSLVPPDDPMSAARLHLQLAHVMHERARWDETLARIDIALPLVVGDDWQARSLRADLQLLRITTAAERGAVDGGATQLARLGRELDEMFPFGSAPHVQAVVEVARAYVALGEVDAAQRELARYLDDPAADADPAWLGALQEGRARAYARAGDRPSARAWAEQAIATHVSSGCGSREAARVQSWLAALESTAATP